MCINTAQLDRINEILIACSNINKLDRNQIEQFASELSTYDLSDMGLIPHDTLLKVQLLMGDLYCRLGNLVKAEELYNKALTILKDNDDISFRIKAINGKCILNAMQSNFLNAIEDWTQLLNNVNDAKLKADIYNNLGISHSMIDQHKEALNCQYKCLQIDEELNRDIEKATDYFNLASSYMKLKQFQKALDLYFEAIKIYEKHQEQRYIGMAYSNICMIYCELNEFEKALEFAQKSLEIKQVFANQTEIANTLSNIGSIYSSQKCYDHALEYYQKSLAIFESSSDKISQAGLYIKLAYLHSNIDNNELAESYLLKGLEIAKSVHSLNIVKEGNRLLSKIYYQQEQYQNAYNHLEEYINAYIKIFEDNPRITIAISESDYYRRKTENQAEVYRQSNIDLTEKNVIITEQSKQINETNTVLRDLLSVMAHDVRGPITSAAQALNMILEGDFNERESDDLIKEIVLSLQNTTQLLNELMEWVNKAKLKGKVVLEPVDVSSVVSDSISLHQNLARLKRVKISFVPIESVFAKAVKNYLMLVIRNLLHNALKFTPIDGNIEVSITTDDKYINILIKDDGIGMTDEEIKAILAGRAQIKTGTNKESGSGFGLDLCQNYLSQMDGKLSLVSELHKGSTFTISVLKA